MKDITIKEVIEYYFDKHLPLPRIYYNTGTKSMLNRTVESYNQETGDFTISGCKDKFNIYESFITIEIESRDEGWDDLVCYHVFRRSFKDIQSLIERNASFPDEQITSTRILGSNSMKYSSSCPTYIETVIYGENVEAIMTYRTVTNIKVGGYYCGGTYSNTSTKWAYEANMTNHYVSFTRITKDSQGE